ncbi:4-diphosphocytidyl-2-C-methyl-D-erythritol kinase [Sinobacterium norvegicum]|uniref:4-diphosphocytidyl-2-C-methyl-D-erythritol kinase n=1 Tax=Sinobacterium norvegicum TaxID=1641715 RepID=A0ABN8EJ80_9GAMM|nr:4-(cytidine 5'-diphospho)-2-C-methyl-D-erythritol kinase [Sinobacterium norvegicum]CAH0991422.1 4-diphosphocytidyl-2-C-methyl-D-erythritol kinase [Sinobacterium norvegicum]
MKRSTAACKAISLPAPAKINLMLHITGQRPDGYHELQTVFQFLDYSDQLHFRLNHHQQINLLTPFEGLPAEQNLIVRAAKLLQQHTGTTLGTDIEIDKILPAGGGLGGGSSNAATTLVALNQLWQTNLTQHQLAELGLALGADVPVFIHGFAAWAEGVGEALQPIVPTQDWLLVICPNVHVSTGEIFCHKKLTRSSKPIKFATALVGDMRNDCQSLVSELYPEVKKALDWASAFAPTLMTGTGACIFSHFDQQSKAEDILARVPGDWQAFVARGVNTSPLFIELDKIASVNH